MSPPTFRPFCGQPYVRIKYAMYSSESTSAVWRGTFVLYPRQNSVFQSICLNGQVTIVSCLSVNYCLESNANALSMNIDIVKLCLVILGRRKPNESLKEASTENHRNNQNRPTTRASYPPAKRISMYLYQKFMREQRLRALSAKRLKYAESALYIADICGILWCYHIANLRRASTRLVGVGWREYRKVAHHVIRAREPHYSRRWTNTNQCFKPPAGHFSEMILLFEMNI